MELTCKVILSHQTKSDFSMKSLFLGLIATHVMSKSSNKPYYFQDNEICFCLIIRKKNKKLRNSTTSEKKGRKVMGGRISSKGWGVSLPIA